MARNLLLVGIQFQFKAGLRAAQHVALGLHLLGDGLGLERVTILIEL